MLAVVQALFALLFPLLALWLARHIGFARALGPAVLCYAAGAAWSLSPLPSYAGAGDAMQSASVLLAIPLLLFSLDFRAWLSRARMAVRSFLLAVASVVILATFAHFAFGFLVPESAKVSAMLVGVYTGGTPNMGAIARALCVAEEDYALLVAADTLLGGLYLFFLLSIAQRFALTFLPPFRHATQHDHPPLESQQHGPVLRWSDAKTMLPALGLAVIATAGAAGVGFGVSALFPEESAACEVHTTGEASQTPSESAGIAEDKAQPTENETTTSAGVPEETAEEGGGPNVPATLLALTTIAVLLSLSSRIRNLRGSYEAGEFLILVFCVAIGTMIDAEKLFRFESAGVVGYGAFVMLGSIALHFGFARLFRIDADTTIITSTAAVYGPPFVGPVAEALRNRAVVISGLTTGLVGYAVGNYVGIALYYLLP